MPKRSKRAALYARLSRPREDDLAGGAGRQIHDHLRPLAARLGYTVVAELGLKDRSASRYAIRQRKQYRELMALVDAGQVDAVLFYDIDRLLRIPRELEDLIDRVEKTGLEVRTINGDLRLDTADGRFIARILVAKAAKEVEDTSRRVKDFRRARRADGLPPCAAAYGWIDTYTVDRDQAHWVEWMVERIQRGESLQNVARQLTAKQIPRRRSAKGWNSDAVRTVVTTPRNYGLVIHHDERCGCKGTGWLPRDPAKTHRGGGVEAVRGDLVQCLKGKVRPSPIAGFLDPELYSQVLSTLAKRSVRSSRPRRGGMLAGLVACSECGVPMLRARTPKGRPTMQCRKVDNSGRCGAGTIDYNTIERAIVALVFNWVDDAELAELVSPHARIDTTAINRRLDVLTVKGEKANRAWLDDGMSDEDHDDALRQIKAEREDLLASLASASSASVLVEYVGQPGVLEKAWPKLSDPVRRQIIVDALDLRRQRLVVYPPPPGPHRNWFDSDDPATIAAELDRLHFADATAGR